MSIKKIESLTSEQSNKFQKYRDHWIEVGLSTKETDRAKAEAAIDKVYKCGNLAPPKQKIWALSPYAGAVLAAKLSKHGKLENTPDPSIEEIREQLLKACYGSHDAAWLGFYSFFKEVCGLKLDKTEGLIEASQHCGWFWPFDKAVIITEKPIGLHRDNENRLHNESGPALYYKDGWGIWSWHGVRIPQRLIEDPDSFSQQEILQENNSEVRRCMIERVGPEKFLEGATLVSEDERGQLMSVQVPNDEPIVFVKVVNSTAEPDGTHKHYFLRVPPNTKTPQEGIAWGFGKREEEYKPVVET